MFRRKLILFTASLLTVAALWLLPRNREWFSERILSYYKDLPGEMKQLDKEARLTGRFENSYTLSKEIAAQILQKGGTKQSLTLIPPPGYFTALGIDYPVPEPAVFYYFTGMKTIWASSKQAVNAGWYAYVRKGAIIVDTVTDRKALQDTITTWRQKWRYPL